MSIEATPAAPATPPAVPPAAAATPASPAAATPATPAITPAPTAADKAAEESRSRLAMQSVQVLKDKQDAMREKAEAVAMKAEAEATKAKIADAAKKGTLHEILSAVGLTPEQKAALLLSARTVEDKPVDPAIAELRAQLAEQQKFVEEQKTRIANDEKAREDAKKAEEHEANVLALTTEIQAEKEKYPFTAGLGITEQVIKKANELVAEGKAFSAQDAIEKAKPLVEAVAEKDLPTFMDNLLTYPKIRAMIEGKIGKAAPPPAAAGTTPAKVETAKLAADALAAKPPPPKWEITTKAPTRTHEVHAKGMVFGSPEWNEFYAKRKAGLV